MTQLSSTSIVVPPNSPRTAEPPLLAGESTVAVFRPDLDDDLRFRESQLVLTDRRLIAVGPDQPGGAAASWELHAGLELVASEERSVGRLSLIEGERQQGVWSYTGARRQEARAFVAAFRRLVESAAGRTPPMAMPVPVDAEAPAFGQATCPACGQPIPVGVDLCPRCSARQSQRVGRSLFRLAGFAHARRWTILFGFVLTLAGTVAGLIPPYVTMPLIDRVLIPAQEGLPVERMLVAWYLSALGGAAVLAWGLGWARTYVLAWVSERISADLRNQTYAHLQRLGLEFFAAKRTGDLIARVGSDTDRICYFLSVHLIDFASDVLMILLTAAILLSIDPVLALATLGPLPLVAWVVQDVRERLRGGFAVSSRAWGDMTSVLADTIPGVRVVKAFAQEQRETQRFRTANEHVLQANDFVNRTWSFFGPLIVLLTDAGLLLVWGIGAWRVFAGQITVGVLTAFVTYITRFYSRLDSMSRMLAAVQRAAASAHRIFEILDQVPSVPEPAQPVHLGTVRGEVELREVTFRYSQRAVLRGINLHVRPGEMIGLVGASGGGKTTLVNLVCRFYDVTSGAILVDGVDIRRIPVAEYRRNIGLVLQEPFLFYGTIAENIAYGRPEAKREEIIAAARAARAHDFIVRLPDGYDSLVGERGQSLSGGERQRISIARALLIDPKILILDEATSSVDTETEREIQLALQNLTRGRTTIAIAHRLSTVQRADRLVVIEHGEIVEEGPHAQLLQAGGVYARLHRAQLELAQQQAV